MVLEVLNMRRCSRCKPRTTFFTVRDCQPNTSIPIGLAIFCLPRMNEGKMALCLGPSSKRLDHILQKGLIVPLLTLCVIPHLFSLLDSLLTSQQKCKDIKHIHIRKKEGEKEDSCQKAWKVWVVIELDLLLTMHCLLVTLSLPFSWTL